MKKVYVVMANIHMEGGVVEGIFSTMEKAVDCLTKARKYYLRSEVSAEIEEWELDACNSHLG